MTESKTPTISPIKHIEYECQQSKYGDHVPKPSMRSMILSPSGGGKTVLLQNMILDIYRGCFNSIYIYIYIDIHLVLVLTLTTHGGQ